MTNDDKDQALLEALPAFVKATSTLVEYLQLAVKVRDAAIDNLQEKVTSLEVELADCREQAARTRPDIF